MPIEQLCSFAAGPRSTRESRFSFRDAIQSPSHCSTPPAPSHQVRKTSRSIWPLRGGKETTSRSGSQGSTLFRRIRDGNRAFLHLYNREGKHADPSDMAGSHLRTGEGGTKSSGCSQPTVKVGNWVSPCAQTNEEQPREPQPTWSRDENIEDSQSWQSPPTESPHPGVEECSPNGYPKLVSWQESTEARDAS